MDYFPAAPVAIAAALLALSPFSEPHLWRHMKRLVGGGFDSSLDMLDFSLHTSLLLLLVLKLLRLYELHRLHVK